VKENCLTCDNLEDFDFSCKIDNRPIPLGDLNKHCRDYKKSDRPLWKTLGEYITTQNEIIALNDSEQIMIKNNISYSFDIAKIKKDITLIFEIIGRGSLKASINEILEYIRIKKMINREDFLYNKWIIPFMNGIYFIPENKFYDLRKESLFDQLGFNYEYLFYEIPFYYPNIKVNCRNFKKALRKWLGTYPNNPVRPSDIFEIIGYMMSLNNSLKTAFLFYGETDTGKTQLSNIIVSILGGKKNVSEIGLQRLNQRFGSTPLQFKIANIYPEIPNTKLFDVGVFKACVGGEAYIPAEIKGGKLFSFRNNAKLLFTANQIPKMNNLNDDAFFNRWILVYFPHQFKRNNHNRISDYYEKIINDPNEMKGIIYESIKAVNRLYKRKHFRLELYKNTKHIWNYESDPLYAFLYDFINRKAKKYILQKEFCEKFNDFLISRGEQTKKQNSITTDLQRFKIGVWQKTHQSERYYAGIEWKKINENNNELSLFNKQFGIEDNL